MKLTKFLLSTLCAASLALVFSACGGSSPGNNSAGANTNKSNTAPPVNSSPATVNKSTPVSNSSLPANKPASKPSVAESEDTQTVEGELQTGKTESVILYVGMESGDYAAYCFANDSEAGRAISAACKNGDKCEVKGEIGEGKCTVPGLEADLSDSGKIVKVTSVKSLGPAKKGK